MSHITKYYTNKLKSVNHISITNYPHPYHCTINTVFKFYSMSTFEHNVLFLETDGYLTTRPRNEATLVNSKVRLECGTKDDRKQLRWRSSTKNRILSFGAHVRQGLNNTLTIDSDNRGRYDLIVKPGLGDAGYYTCEEPESYFKVHLTVLGKQWLRLDTGFKFFRISTIIVKYWLSSRLVFFSAIGLIIQLSF